MRRRAFVIRCGMFVMALMLCAVGVRAADAPADLAVLIREALEKNPEILASQARLEGARQRVPQAESLPDPMLSAGYQNMGFERYSYGEYEFSQWMFEASQTFPFPGKRSLRAEASRKESESLGAAHESVRLKIVLRVKELYYDLLLGYRNLDLIRERTALAVRIEEAALARYATGSAGREEVMTSQAEKYLLLEREETERRRIEAIESGLNQVTGRPVNAPLGRPVLSAPTPFPADLEELVRKTETHSPELASRGRMVDAARARETLAKREALPDVTFTAGYANRAGGFRDMWSLSMGIPLPIYFGYKQKPGIAEASAGVSASRFELEGARTMLLSSVRENLAAVRSAERLMALYREGLIPKTRQDLDFTLAGYLGGKGDVAPLLTRLKALYDYEFAYWTQFTEREKAIARIDAVTGTGNGTQGDTGK